MPDVKGSATAGLPATTLESLPIGACARVRRVGGSGTLRRRLMDMGIVTGAQVLLVRHAPLGDPLQIHVRGYDLALRRAEAKLVEVEPCEERKS